MKHAMFVFALCVLSSQATAQEKKDETKDVTTEVTKMVKDGKLLLGNTGKRFVVLDNSMSIVKATQTGTAMTITVSVGKPQQDIRFVELNGLIAATFDPKKTGVKERKLGTNGKEHFKFAGTLTISIPDTKKLSEPVLNPINTPKKGDGKKGNGPKGKSVKHKNRKNQVNNLINGDDFMLVAKHGKYHRTAHRRWNCGKHHRMA